MKLGAIDICHGSVADAMAAADALGLPRLEAQMLLLHALGRAPLERAWLLAHDRDALDSCTWQHFSALYGRRLAGEPLAYIVGFQAFYGLNLKVDPRVLVPRADTETLVDWALELLQGIQAPWVIDVGTGSGAIALAIASKRPDAQLTAVDASVDALAVAQSNAQALGLSVVFRLGDWLEPAASHGQRYHLIAANPPYIAPGDPHLAALAHEPTQALVAPDQGLADLHTLAMQAPGHLLPGGWLLLEHGYDQAQAVQSLLATQGFTHISSHLDLAGIARVTGGQWPVAG
jgi:release factor glutamine methyltransferase